jgi:hypothetical protein
MRASRQQIVGRFLFDDRGPSSHAGRRPKITVAPQTDDAHAIVACLLAIALTAAALWCLGL